MSRATSKFGDYAVHNEWQQRKGEAYLFKQAKKNRKKVGELRKYNDGRASEYIIERRAEELVYCKDAWAIDRSIMSLLYCLGRPNLRMEVSNGDVYSISFAVLEAQKQSRPDPKHAMKWFVDFCHFSFERGEPESLEKSLMIGKWK